MNGHEKVLQLLIESKADVTIADLDGNTPLHCAILLEGGDESIIVRNLIVQKLINANAEVNAIDKYGNSPLYWATIKEYIQIVEMLVEANADVNIQNMYRERPIDTVSDNEELKAILSKVQRKVPQLVAESNSSISRENYFIYDL